VCLFLLSLDCPVTLPPAPQPTAPFSAFDPLNDLQLEFVKMAAGFTGEESFKSVKPELMFEGEAEQYIRSQIAKMTSKKTTQV
jgi:hypothetical protein